MASKKKLAQVIEKKCPKCGKLTNFSLVNLKDIKLAIKEGETVPAGIYRCDICGYKFMK